MPIEKKPFENYKLAEEKEQQRSQVFTIRFNRDEIAELEENARVLRQEKLGATVKQLIHLGIGVLHDPKVKYYIDVVFNNERRNQRLGIGQVKPNFWQK